MKISFKTKLQTNKDPSKVQTRLCQILVCIVKESTYMYLLVRLPHCTNWPQRGFYLLIRFFQSVNHAWRRTRIVTNLTTFYTPGPGPAYIFWRSSFVCKMILILVLSEYNSLGNMQQCRHAPLHLWATYNNTLYNMYVGKRCINVR